MEIRVSIDKFPFGMSTNAIIVETELSACAWRKNKTWKLNNGECDEFGIDYSTIIFVSFMMKTRHVQQSKLRIVGHLTKVCK
jgi:hypothetical protein